MSLLSCISKPGKDTRSLNLDLKIVESYTRNVGKGVARLDYDPMESLGASTGDIIELKVGEKSRNGSRRTVAKCLPLYPSDESKGLIRIDGLVRNNAGRSSYGVYACYRGRSYCRPEDTVHYSNF